MPLGTIRHFMGGKEYPSVFIGGNFTAVSDEDIERNRIASYKRDSSTTDLTDWNPDCNAIVRALVKDGKNIYLGGNFTTVGGVERNRAACVNSSSSNLMPWNPDCESAVWFMIKNGNDIYMGGAFTTVGVTTRNRGACVDSDPSQATPTLRPWNPNINSTVRTMLLDGSDMFLGGDFSSVRGTTRNRAACVDSDPSQATPTLRPWNPNCGGTTGVTCFVKDGNDMYLSGDFTSVRGTTRNRAACVDSDTSQANPALRPWNPRPNIMCYTIIKDGNDMYLGGSFGTVMGTTRRRVACVDSDSSQANPTLRPFNPNCNSTVRMIGKHENDIYIVGDFSTVGGISRVRGACVDSDSSQASPIVRPWNPILNGVGWYIFIPEEE